MGGTAPANQLRLSFAGSEDGEAETETCRSGEALVANDGLEPSGPARGLNLLNRPMRTRLSGGVGGASRVTAPPIPICYRWWLRGAAGPSVPYSAVFVLLAAGALVVFCDC